ncbi:MAG: HD domain-containing protein, partial [Bacteroidetes bacterium]
MTATPTIVNKAEKFVRPLLKEGLTADHFYHNLPHTLSVVDATRLLIARHELKAEDAEALELAAWFHDTGFTQTYEGHEIVSAEIAQQFLQSENYDEDRLATVQRLILATQAGCEPKDLLEKIICDADLSNLGRADYLALLSGLRHEWEVFRQESYSDEKWYRLNYKFVKSHKYYTQVAEELYGPQYQQNLSTLKKLRKKKKKKGRKKDTRTGDTIATNRSAQMMFKTALRNHMDLSNLADNKANIMLSVNALIVTIAVPMAAGYVKNSPHLAAPVIVLLLTCLCSMIFATLATRPIQMTGITSPEDIKQGKSNLFFFGNFYRMSLEAYDEGMDEIISKDQNLDSAIKRDLY